MPKNIILFSDGTGNSSGKLFKTNVWRLYQALDLSGDNHIKPKQIAYYDDGVGTSSFKPFALLGGAFGWGLKRNVLDLYTFLCWNYTKGDPIYCFGFSRGAFTMRVLTGLIQSQGLVRSDSQVELRRLAKKAFRAYRQEHYKTWMGLERIGRVIRDGTVDLLCKMCGRDTSDSMTDRENPPITFIGLWDTVAAYGLPIDELTRAWNAVFPLSTPDRNLSPNITRACHALALDDERNSFHPVLWNEEPLPTDARRIQDERLSQVWFVGAHTNVGGGYPDDGLAYVSLDWMMTEAARPMKGTSENPSTPGLLFKNDERRRIQSSINPFGKIYDSRHGLGGTYRYLPRKLSTLTNDRDDKENPVIIKRPKIHESVIKRIKEGVDGYAPFIFPAQYAVVKANGEIIDQTSPTIQQLALIEDSKQAEIRVNLQEHVWNLIWWKRVAYFTSTIVVAALVTFPLYQAATSACEGKLCALSPFVNLIGTFVPGFASSWLEAFTSHPGTFSALSILLATLVFIGSHLQDKIKDRMRTFWKPFTGKTTPPSSIEPLPQNIVYRLRSHPAYQTYFKVMKRYILPTIFGLIAVVAIGQGTARGLFAIMTSGGLTCSESTSLKVLDTTFKIEGFSPNAICWASGVKLLEGKRYQLTLRINNRNAANKKVEWKDRNTLTGVGGFSWNEMPILMYGGLLLRRHIAEPWFKPIARIGSTGTDEYPLNPADQSKPDQNTKTLVAEITARRDGELFLFVNDAAIPGPANWQFLYTNNHGAATISVKEIK